MNRIKKLIALTSMMAVCVCQLQGQEYQGSPPINEQSDALNDSEQASYLSALLPIGAIVVAAVIIATTNRHHHHHSSSSSSEGGSITKIHPIKSRSSSSSSGSSSCHHSHCSSCSSGHF